MDLDSDADKLSDGYDQREFDELVPSRYLYRGGIYIFVQRCGC